VDVAAEVIEQMLRRTKRLFGVDDPRLLAQLFEQVVEGFRIGQRSGLTWEDELVLIEGLLEKVEELTLEDDTEGFDTEEEVFSGRDPTGLIEREHSFWEEAVEVEVVLELLIPGVQDTDKAWGSPQVSTSEG
jgi:hypothetical protein